MFDFYYASCATDQVRHIRMNDEEVSEFIHNELHIYPHEFIIYVSA